MKEKVDIAESCYGKLDVPLLIDLMELQSADESNNLPQYANQNQ